MIITSSSDCSPVAPAVVAPKLPVTVDTKGRVRTSKEQRRVILAEFERSGVSASQFARRTGLKYSTLAAWLQRYRRAKRPRPPVTLTGGGGSVSATQPAFGGAAARRGAIGSSRSQPSPIGGGFSSRSGEAVPSFSGSLKVFVAVEPCDMRKGFNGLFAAVTERLGEDPKGGALYVFCNRRHTRIKILYWDGTGLWVLTKRLEKGTFSWPKTIERGTTKLCLRAEALALLTDGVDLRGAKLRPWYEREA